MALWFRVNINFYCTQKNDVALGASASCNIIFLSAIKNDIALTQVPYLYNISNITLKHELDLTISVQILEVPPQSRHNIVHIVIALTVIILLL